MSSPRIQVYDTSSGHYDALKVANGKLQADIFTSSNLSVDIASSSGTLSVDGSANTQPISATALPLPSGASTLIEQERQTTHLATLAGRTLDTSAVAGSVVIQGKDGATSVDVAVDDQGHLLTHIEECHNVGSHNNLWANASVSASGVSSTVNISNINVCNIFYNDGDHTSTDTVSVWVSPDNSHFYRLTRLYPWDEDTDGATRETVANGLNISGLTHLYLQNDGGAKTSVNATIVGTPN